MFNTNSSKVGHIHDERYYTETEIDGRFTSLTTGETLLSILKYLPSKYLDDPPKYLNLSGYDIEIYVSRSQVTISGTGYWACVLGVHDNNNGNLKGAQVAITTGATYQRSFTYQSGWTSWGRLWSGIPRIRRYRRWFPSSTKIMFFSSINNIHSHKQSRSPYCNYPLFFHIAWDILNFFWMN